MFVALVSVFVVFVLSRRDNLTFYHPYGENGRPNALLNP